MAAYRADIEIGVKGIQQLQAITRQINTLSTGVDSVNKRLANSSQSINAYNANLAKAAATLNKVNAGTIAEADAVRQYVQALGQANAARDRQNRLIQEQIALQRKAVPTANAGFGVQGPALPRAQGQRGIAGSNFRDVASNAIIGGAFPLLFGQGTGAAVGGGLGGAIGGAFGGTLGFGLSLVGTAIGQAIDEAQTLNKELIGLNNNLTSTGNKSKTTASDVSQLASQLGIAKDEAVKLISAFSEFDSAGVREALAASFGAVGGEEAFNALAAAIDNKSTLEAIVKLRDVITDTQAKEALKQLEINGSASANVFLQERLIQLQEQKLIKQAEEITLLDRILAGFAALGAQGQFIDPGLFGRERAQDIRNTAAERKRAQQQALDDTRKFLVEVNRLTDKFTAKPKAPRKGPQDRTAALLADLQALQAIGEAEDRIRDLRFQEQDALAVTEQRNKTLADIERDRVKQLQQANFQTERAAINEIARERAIQAQRLAADELRNVESDRVKKAIDAKNAIDDAIQPILDVSTQQKAQLEDAQKFNNLVRQGILPAEAERLINFERLVARELQNLDITIARNQARVTELKTEVKSLEVKADALDLEGGVTDEILAQIQARAGNINKIQDEIDALRARRAAISGAAATGPGAGPSRSERLQSEIGRLQGDLNQLIDPINQVTTAAQSIGTAFAQSFRDIISGTVGAQQALSNFFSQVAASFLDNAAQIIATQLQIYLLQTVLGFIGGGRSGFSFSGAGPVSGASVFGSGQAGFNPAAFGGTKLFAEGGFVTGPTRALIGEGGEPEYVIPASKMPGAMARYAAGLRGGSVIDGAVFDNRNFLDSLTTAINNPALLLSQSSEDDVSEKEAAATQLQRIKENNSSIRSITERATLEQRLESDQQRIIENRNALASKELNTQSTYTNTNLSSDQIFERERFLENRSELATQQSSISSSTAERERIFENRMQLDSQRSALDRRYESERLRENRMEIMNQQSETERRFERERIEKMAAMPQKLDISYQSQVINSVEYVTRDEAERLAAQSAIRGRELALGSLQNSVKTRKRVGMA